MERFGTAKLRRRTFIQAAGLGASLGLLGDLDAAASPGVAIVVDPIDQVANAAPAKWAVQELIDRLKSRGLQGRIVPALSQAAPADLCVLATGPLLTPPAVMPVSARPPVAAESFCLSTVTLSRRRVTVASGHDARGLVYALLELSDRVEYEDEPVAAFQIAVPIKEAPVNKVRSVLRAFVSEVEDKPWYYDRAAWRDYLTMLATHRFNRINLSFGIGYDFVTDVRDSYFHFPYPFLLNVPGYNVKVTISPPFPGAKPDEVSNDERARNLDLLQFISAAAVERGLDFQLGIWTHAWNFEATPYASHRITGLTPATHAAYCRDAITQLLTVCPAISGVTLRTHGESGVPEESYPFWKTVFSGIAAVGRPIEIDQHAKGIDAEMIGLAQATHMPTAVSPKFWAEHMGLPYHQADIRPTEMPKAGAADTKGALMALSTGSRSFLRYGYGDLLREDRRYSIVHRIWPGTQRLLLWGDPLMAAAYGNASSFSGSNGVEWMEPLSFKGRKGSGLPGGRDGYQGAHSPDERDWDKYRYTYRVWGRGLYNPATDAEARKRFLRKALGAAGESAAAALALSSRILPTVTTAHMPSAANNNYWPEIYTNQSIAKINGSDPYSDTPAPRRFGTVSPLDSRLFCTIDECADDLLKGESRAAYSPVEVAAWLEELARDSEANLNAAAGAAGAKKTPDHERWAIDIGIQNGLGRFFAAKFRAGVLYGIYAKSADPNALKEALAQYRKARDAWKTVSDIAFNVYRPDLSFGYLPHLRGSWQNRLPAIEQDLAAMEAAIVSTAPTSAGKAIEAALSRGARAEVTLNHTPIRKFRAGTPLTIDAALPAGTAGELKLIYRHVSQAERWIELPMEATAEGFRAAIPAAYTNSPYPLQYYFEVHLDSGHNTVSPGLTRDYSTPPYYLVRKA